MNLNGRALRVVEALLARAEERKVAAHPIEGGGRFVDCGIEVRGRPAGRARPGPGLPGRPGRGRDRPRRGRRPRLPAASRSSPITRSRACLASQYAGWAISEGKFFAMGSGPMRAVAGPRADLRDDRLSRASATRSSACSRRRKPPTPAVVARIAAACRVAPSAVTLLVAPTASLAGGLQVVARSVETALHKLAELELRPLAGSSRRTGRPPCRRSPRTTWPRSAGPTTRSSTAPASSSTSPATTPASSEVGPQVPSSASRDHGEPFAAIFARYNHDFYAVDPHLFSPAEVVFQNLETGRVHAFGRAGRGRPGPLVLRPDAGPTHLRHAEPRRPRLRHSAGTSRTSAGRPGARRRLRGGPVPARRRPGRAAAARGSRRGGST